MKRLESYDPPRQQMWEHDGRRYSIVDLTLLPRRKDMLAMGMSLESEKYLEFYRPYNFELAEITDGRVEVLERFASYEEAREFIKAAVDA